MKGWGGGRLGSSGMFLVWVRGRWGDLVCWVLEDSIFIGFLLGVI